MFIDEAQRVAGIGLTLKIITDQFKDVQLYVSGSSSFGISNELNEPLTGRKWEYELLPVSWEEFEDHHGRLAAEQQLENRLLYGFYPDVLNNPGSEALWENFLISERLKQNLYKNTFAGSYFWRTKQQQEIDFVEEKDGKITGWEFKWRSKTTVRLSRTFTETYKADSRIIDRSNFRDFVII